MVVGGGQVQKIARHGRQTKAGPQSGLLVSEQVEGASIQSGSNVTFGVSVSRVRGCSLRSELGNPLLPKGLTEATGWPSLRMGWAGGSKMAFPHVPGALGVRIVAGRLGSAGTVNSSTYTSLSSRAVTVSQTACMPLGSPKVRVQELKEETERSLYDAASKAM